MIIVMSIVVLGTITKIYYDYNNNLNQKLKVQAEANLSNSTKISVQVINTKINSISSSLQNIAFSLSIKSLEQDSSDLTNLLAAFQKQNKIDSLTYHPREELSDNSMDYYINSVMIGQQNMYIDNTQAYVHILTPVKTNNNVSGYIKASYTLANISNLFSSKTFNGKGNVFLLQNDSNVFDGKTIDNADNFLAYLGNASFYDDSSIDKLKNDLLQGNSGILHYNINNQDYYAQYLPLGLYGLSLYHQVESDALAESTISFTSLAGYMFNEIMIIMLIFILFILIIQIINNRIIVTHQGKLLIEKERYQTVLSHTQGAVWEYEIATDTLTKSDPDLGLQTFLSVIPNYENYIKESNVIHPDYVDKFDAFYKAMRMGQKDIITEVMAKDISGKMVWFELSGTTIYDNNGIPVSVIGQTVNIDSRKRELEELRDNANRDSLTKLYNRNALINKVNQILDTNNKDMIHAVFMIDIDNFKKINDTYGHTFGDAVLIDLSTKLNKYFKEPHILSRIGGDEFVIFLYNIHSLAQVKEKAEKIINIFRKMYIGGTGNHAISGSVGVALYPEHGKAFQELIYKSDISLYHSKSIGKNCYSIYQENMIDVIKIPDIKENHLESKYQKENHAIIDSSIIVNTVNLLFDAKDMNSSINMILSVIGNYYNLDCLTITEFSDDLTTASVTFEWCSEPEKRISSLLQKIPMETMSKYIFYKSAENAVYFNNNLKAFDQPQTEYTSLLESYAATSSFQCAIYENNTNKGFISAFLCNPKKSFSELEVNSLTILSKIIGGYLLKLRAQQKVDWIATKDPLTGSYNLFQFTIEATKIVSNNPDKKFIIIYTDLDKFKLINETYGYSEGDRVLREFANRLKNMSNKNEIFGRVSGDRFVGLFVYENKTSFLRRLDTFTKSLNQISKTENDYYKLSIIIGLYPITDTDENMSLNIDRANIARKSITERHKTTFVFFNETMKSRLVKQREIEDIMEEALQDEEFIIYYQPKFNLNTNTICGAEALVRWDKPGVGIIPPGEFIPIFEENGFIIDIDYYVFDKVCAHIRSLLDREMHVVPISVNFSRMHLKNRNLVSHLKNTTFRYDIPTSLIEIEITESALVDNNTFLLPILHDIHNAGFRLSMDDFGSGLSSLNMLRTMPFDVLKLDKNFFHSSTTTERERVVITNVVKMANELYMDIVSEGVETEEQANLLRNINCPIAQGFLFERPIPIELYEEKYC